MRNQIRFVSSFFIVIFCCIRFIDASKCNEKTCNPTHPNKLNVHLVPHTHDDVGWLKTVDQYYYGGNKGHAPFGVQYILDSVISELQKNPDRRFIYVESAFFWRWWESIEENEQKQVKDLVKEGRLEFVHGGWCMSDEATPHYTSMIDQMTLGLKFLNDTFEECGRPTVAWQIDPFGHSSELAIEFAEMGYDSLFVSRIDYEDHSVRKNSKQMEMIWRPDTSLGESGDLFLNIMYNTYTSPSGFCFDTYCNDEPIMDNRKLHGYNVDDRIQKFEDHVQVYRKAYRTNHILIPMGGDFTYSVASSWFKNIDKLIRYTNEKFTSINLLYSTPDCYIRAINAANTTWPVKDNDDFFPYASDEHSYWTGYFTSRPAFKYMVYRANNALQAVKQTATLLGNNFEEEELKFKRALGISQHHDAVSGTEKQHVTDDYALYLHEGLVEGRKIFNEAFKFLYTSEYPEHHLCNLKNISQCDITESTQNFVVTLYNPSPRRINSIPLRFPIIGNAKHQVYSSSGAFIDSDVIPLSEGVLKIPGRKSNATTELVFLAKDIPPLGATNFYIQTNADNKPSAKPQPVASDADFILDNGLVQLTFNGTSGLLRSVKKNGTEWNLAQNFYTYDAMKGYNYNADTRASGAYIFRPKGEAKPVKEKAIVTQYRGKYVQEVHQVFTPWLSQIIRLYQGVEDVEFEWLIGPIPIIEWTGMEIITRYTTDLPSNGVFYTDSNGRRWIKRERNRRKSWNLTITEPVSCNYYPLTSAISLKSNEKQVTVVTDRPQGGTSMTDGQLEVMLHRRLLYDDNFGVVEPLDEIAFGEGLVVRGKHTVQLNLIASAAESHRFKAAESAYGAIPLFAKTNYKLEEWTNKFNKNVTLMKAELPPNVQITTLERWRENQILLRLEHLFELNESSNYSKPVTVDIEKLFSFFGVDSYKELTLAANQEKVSSKRLKWRTPDNPAAKAELNKTGTDKIITLQPMQIRTFLLNVTPIKRR
ncbi:lysosomal alpha-mannosidase-like [Planococcus citri]|uniref:lysosomal alpha-mannosidase-like n=1 Tax=Planococcus citri TaxID=170843 RepID=UPI0031F947DE